MIIELVGYPGVGKTSLATKLEELSAGEVRNLSRVAKNDFANTVSAGWIQKVKFRLAAWIENPSTTICAYKLAFCLDVPWFEKIKLASRLSFIIYKSAKVRASHTSISVVDELLIHGLFSIFIQSSKKLPVDQIMQLFRHFYKKNDYLLVEIVVPSDVIIERLRKRSAIFSRFNSESTEEELALLRADENYATLLHCYEAVTGMNILRVSGEQSLYEATSECLLEIFDTRGRR